MEFTEISGMGKIRFRTRFRVRKETRKKTEVGMTKTHITGGGAGIIWRNNRVFRKLILFEYI